MTGHFYLYIYRALLGDNCSTNVGSGGEGEPVSE